MDKRIRDLYNEDILKEATSRYDVDVNNVKKLDGFENYIYEYEKNGEGRILRITHKFHRSIVDLNAEMEWMNYLGEMGGDVAIAIKSESGRLAEKIDIEDSYFVVSAMKKASGTEIKKVHWDKTLFKAWGKAIGKLHKITKDYIPSGTPRFQWDDEYIVSGFKRYIPDSEKIVSIKIQEIINKIKNLEKGRDNYGLIHTDVHQGNFFWDDGKITIFDFDDCAYKHFVSDIAIAVFYSMMSKNEFKSKEDFAEYFLRHFMDGYSLENTLDDKWLKMLPDFLKLREIILYIAISRSHDPANPDRWGLDYIKNHKSTIENDIPILFRDII